MIKIVCSTLKMKGRIVMCNVNEKGAVNFLLFSYFGIRAKDKKDEIIDAAINKAYQEATNQGAFNALFNKGSNAAKDKIKTAKSGATENLKNLIVDKVMKTSLENDKDWHEKICDEVFENFSEDLEKEVKNPDIIKQRGKRVFSYGNAQKWVNMTLKNLYIISAILLKYSPEKWEDKPKWTMLYNNAKHFHIPIDNYILQAAFESKELKHNPKCFDDESKSKIWIRRVDKTTYKIKFEEADEYTWSQIPTYEEYLKVQNVLLYLFRKNPRDRENDQWIEIANSLDWENDKWIKIAKNRKSDKKTIASTQE